MLTLRKHKHVAASSHPCVPPLRQSRRPCWWPLVARHTCSGFPKQGMSHAVASILPTGKESEQHGGKESHAQSETNSSLSSLCHRSPLSSLSSATFLARRAWMQRRRLTVTCTVVAERKDENCSIRCDIAGGAPA